MLLSDLLPLLYTRVSLCQYFKYSPYNIILPYIIYIPAVNKPPGYDKCMLFNC